MNFALKFCLFIWFFSFQNILAQFNGAENDFINGGSSYEILDPGEPFVKIGKRFYIIHQGRKVSWYEAFYLCTTYGAELADIQNGDEMQAITDHLLDMQVTDKDFFWISANALMGPERVFMWANKRQHMSYTNWRSAQPDNAGKKEFCAHLWPEPGARTVHMNDWICAKQAYFICVHPTANIIHNPRDVVDVKPAPPLEGHVQIGAKHYRIVDGLTANWFEAENNCNEQNMHLAEIQNVFERNAISQHLMGRGFNNKQFWVAGNDRYREGAFMWTRPNNYLEVTYTKWSANNPDNFFNNQDCIVLWKKREGWTMDDDNCEKRFNFICQRSTQYPRYELIQH